MDPRSSARFPSDVQVRLHRQELEQQRRVEQLEQARQMNQISLEWTIVLTAYMCVVMQLHLMSFSYLANIMAMRERKRQNVPAYHQRCIQHIGQSIPFIVSLFGYSVWATYLHYHGEPLGLELKMETQQQEWRRRAGRRSAADTGSAALSTGTSSHLRPSTGGVPANTGHTVSSSSKIVRKSATQSINGHAKPSAAPIPPSRWKELRQSVRIKATVDTEERRIVNAKIADLCEEDREKVAKLIQRIVEIGTLQEEVEAEFSRQRDLYEAEIRELREQVKRDASELEDLSDKLKATLLKLRDYQERVLVLEESNDVETRHRLETDQTMDLLKMEVEKLRKLVRKQKEEMDLKDQEEQTKFKVELERVQQQLRDAQDELLHERRDRIQEKQRELDERLARSVANNASAVAVTKKAYSLEDSSASSLSQAKQTEGASIPSIPQLDMSSFLNTSIELPERIKDIIDEWKQRMEDAIVGTVRSIADQSRVMSNSAFSRGIERPVDSHVDGEEEDSGGNASSGDDNEDERGDVDHSHPYQDEPNSRASRVQQQNSQSERRKTLQLGSVPKVNRKPFDKYLSIESEVGSDAENESHESPRGREVSSQEEEEEEGAEEEQKQVRHTHQRRESERRDNRTECADGVSTRPHHSRHPRAHALKPSGVEMRSQRQHRCRRERRDGGSQDEDGHHSYSREARHISEEDEDGELEKRERGRPLSEVTLTGSVHNQPFVLINGGYQGGRNAGVNTSFSNLYETSLFDVVDAMEGSQVPIQASPPSQTSRSRQQPADVAHTRHFDTEEDTNSSSSVRLQSLLQGMQARERKLARLGGNNNSLASNRDAHQPTPTSGFNVDDGVDDFEIFNEVKDIYEKELFESRQQREAWASTGGGGTASSTIFQHNLQCHSQPWSSGLSDSRGSSLGPPLSQQDLFVREAIEKEMTELLQEEAFQELLH